VERENKAEQNRKGKDKLTQTGQLFMDATPLVLHLSRVKGCPESIQLLVFDNFMWIYF